MQLFCIGFTEIEPVTGFYWDSDSNAVLEVTELGESLYLVKASKSYRLLKQDENGQETWDRNLVKMNDYLSDKFSSFSISVDYCDTVNPEILGEKDRAEDLIHTAVKLESRVSELKQKREQLRVSTENSIESLQNTLHQRFEAVDKQLQEKQKELDRVYSALEEKKDLVNQWKKNGVSVSYLFTFSTDPEIIPAKELEQGFNRHLTEVYNLHRRKVKQVLQGPKFKLNVTELSEPRIFNRMQYTGLMNPEGFETVLNQIEQDDVAERVESVRNTVAQQYMAVAMDDLQVDGSTAERSKSTPSRAVNSILQSLESERIAYADNTPQDGPMIGTLAGTEQVVGFDPAELPHYYIMGETGSGKSYLKRVLIENVASLGYDVLSISPSDREELGLSLPNPDNQDGQGISVDQYWLGDTRLLDKPGSVIELFEGLNALTLRGLQESDKQEYVNKVFTELSKLDRSSKPLFVFLEEAHNFNEDETADAIQDLVREARKFGIHVVIVSQNPTDFSHNHRHVRENTVSVFLRGEYTDYAGRFMDDSDVITDLKSGRAVIQSPEYSNLMVDIRNTLTKPTSPSKKEIKELDARFTQSSPSIETNDSDISLTETETHLSDDEQKLKQYIQRFISENDERPTKSKCYRPSDSPFGSSKTGRLLEEMVEKDILAVENVTRYGNESQVYSIK